MKILECYLVYGAQQKQLFYDGSVIFQQDILSQVEQESFQEYKEDFTVCVHQTLQISILWDALDQQVFSVKYLPCNIQKFKYLVFTFWNQIAGNFLRFISDWVKAILLALGWQTLYWTSKMQKIYPLFFTGNQSSLLDKWS